MSLILDGTGTISGVSATGLTTAQNVGYAQLPTGSVLQVVNNTAQYTSNYFATGSTSYVSTGFAVTITPKFSNSKIYLSVTAPCEASATGVVCLYTIYRGGTNLATGTALSALGTLRSSAGYVDIPVTMTFLDSPATTSATTYTVYMAVTSGNGAWGNNPSSSSAAMSFTAMEVAG